MKSSILTVIFISTFLSVFVSCNDDDGDGGSQKKHQEVVFDISDAQNLAILEDTNLLRSETSADEISGNELYKITIDGNFEKVDFINADGSPLDEGATNTSMNVRSITDLTDEYLYINGDFQVYDTIGNEAYYSTILVRKTDGTIYNFEKGNGLIREHEQRHFVNDKNFAIDANNRLYYTDYNRSFLRLDLNKLPDPSVTDISISGQSFYDYEIDASGNVYWNDGTDGLRLLKNSGGIKDISSDSDFYWVGNNGEFYFIEQGVLYQTKSDDQSFDSVTVVANIHASDYVYLRNNYNYSHFKRNDLNIFIATMESASSNYRHYYFSETTNTFTEITLPETPKEIIETDDKLYMYKGTTVFSLDLNNFTSQTISTDEYQIYSLGLKEKNTFLFSGIRYSDGKKVLGEMDINGSVKIIEEELDRYPTYLTRID